MKHDEFIPICAECKHANEYLPYYTYPFSDPKCEIFHIQVKPEKIACSRFEAWGQRKMNKLVKFKQKYLEQIKKGVKTQTMRMPHKRIDVEPEEKVIALFPDGKELLLKITNVGYKSFKSINDEDAVREGFTTADELKQELIEIYKDYRVADYNRFYYYQFEYLGNYR